MLFLSTKQENVDVYTVEDGASYISIYSIVSKYGIICIRTIVNQLDTTVPYDIDTILLLKSSILYVNVIGKEALVYP